MKRLRSSVCEEKMLSEHGEGAARFQTNWYQFPFIFSQVCQISVGSDICKVDGTIKVDKKQPIENELMVEKLQSPDTPIKKPIKKSDCVNTHKVQCFISQRDKNHCTLSFECK